MRCIVLCKRGSGVVTRLFEFVGDDASDEMRMGRLQVGHQLVQRFLGTKATETGLSGYRGCSTASLSIPSEQGQRLRGTIPSKGLGGGDGAAYVPQNFRNI